MRENTDQNNSENGHFLRSEDFVSQFSKVITSCWQKQLDEKRKYKKTCYFIRKKSLLQIFIQGVCKDYRTPISTNMSELLLPYVFCYFLTLLFEDVSFHLNGFCFAFPHRIPL